MPPSPKTPTNRMEPLGQVARELWILSGNECAFEACTERLISEDGAFIGEVAHIHGVEPSSARHNPALDREALRAADNLMLLCPNHHTRIDHVNSRSKYPTPMLRRMKRTHEDRFRAAAAYIEAQFTDHTTATTVRYATTLNAFHAAIGVDKLTPDEKQEDVRLVNAIADRLAELTLTARSLLSFLVQADAVLGIAEVSRRTRRSQSAITSTMEELDRLGYAYLEREPDEDEPRGALKLLAPTSFDGWPLWDDLRSFLGEHPEHLARVIVDLDFDLLD
ncbi:hypothetical protein [Streptomyces californicus]|uniref:hypothetical protein n=1 Tax=Streptomyces californicus TaxID=67351 RepID=UPI00296EE87E|nr:hypothetical protein [Streptomyces californicus]MDW4912618.1 hypothetical protein [Streptomyces californicus]